MPALLYLLPHKPHRQVFQAHQLPITLLIPHKLIYIHQGLIPLPLTQTGDLHILPDRMAHHDTIIEDLLHLTQHRRQVRCVLYVRIGYTRYLCEVVGYLLVRMHVAVEETPTALPDYRNAR